MKRSTYFAAAALLAVSGCALAQQSNVTGFTSKNPQFSSVRVGFTTLAECEAIWGAGQCDLSAELAIHSDAGFSTGTVASPGSLAAPGVLFIEAQSDAQVNSVTGQGSLRGETFVDVTSRAGGVEVEAATDVTLTGGTAIGTGVFASGYDIRLTTTSGDVRLQPTLGTMVVDANGGPDELVIDEGTITILGTATVNGSNICRADGTGCPLTETTGTFTASFDTGCTTTPTITFDYVKVASIVTVMTTAQTGMPCTGDAVTMETTGTPIPAAIRPVAGVATVNFLTQGGVTNNGTSVPGCIAFSESGNVSFSLLVTATGVCSPNTWTAAGSRTTANLTSAYTWHTADP